MKAALLVALATVAATPLARDTGVGDGRSVSLRAQEPEGVAPDYGCTICHADKRRAIGEGVHAVRGVLCDDCHGGDPRSVEVATAHVGDFIGPPTKIMSVGICTRCHSDPNQMRQYGLPSDQLAELRASLHGQLLLEEDNTDAPSCADCHDPHTTRPAIDVRSTVNPLNVARTCGRCHEDETMMGRYGLPTDQIAEHRRSQHGVALYDHHNTAAPTCIDCHGSHAALPPALGEITNVCGRCHVNIRRSFDLGPHGDAVRAGALAGCTACHSNHGTERVRTELISTTCTGCHDPESPPAVVGREIEDRMLAVERDLAAAEQAIRELVRAGRRVETQRFGYQTAVTDYRQIAHAQHALDLTTLEDLSRRVGSISREIRATEEAAAEERWEHKLLLIPIWFLALSVVVLAWMRVRRTDA